MNARKTGRKQNSTKSNGQHASQQTETACDQILYKATFHVNFRCSNTHFAGCLAMQLPSKKTEMPNTSGTGYWPSVELPYPNLESNHLRITFISMLENLFLMWSKLIWMFEIYGTRNTQLSVAWFCSVYRVRGGLVWRAWCWGRVNVWVWTFYTLPPNSPKQTMSDFSWKDSCLNTSINWSIVHPKISQGGLQEQNITCYSLECSTKYFWLGYQGVCRNPYIQFFLPLAS